MTDDRTGTKTRVNPHAGEHGLFFVDKDSDGISVVRTPKYMHTHGEHPIFEFKDAFVPADNMIDPAADAMHWTHEWFRYERLMIAARCCGAASRLIDEASKFVDLDQLCLSPQCGFASTEEGNVLAEEQQWAKLREIIEISEEVWG